MEMHELPRSSRALERLHARGPLSVCGLKGGEEHTRPWTSNRFGILFLSFFFTVAADPGPSPASTTGQTTTV